MRAFKVFASIMFLATWGGLAMAEVFQADPGSLKEIVEKLEAGDTVVLSDGEYEGGVVISASGTPENPVIIKAAGKNALFRGGRDGIRLDGSYITLEGVRVTGAERGGITSGRNTGCVIRNCVSFENGVWGIFSGFSEGLVVEGNECYGQKTEHGIYLSNSTDNAVVRGNHSHHNMACGIQFNGDPQIPGGDGIMSGNLVENNILHDNFTNLNLACFSDSVVRNNLIYHCKTKAIALWDDGNTPEYGSKNNLIINNTIIMDNVTRECIQLRNGSTGNTIRNNLFVAPFYAVIADDSSIEGTVIDHNLYSGTREPEKFLWAGEYLSIAQMRERGFCEGAVQAGATFTSARRLRRAIAEGGLPKPIDGPKFVAPAECDFRLTSESPAIDAGLDDAKAGESDLDDKPRRTGKSIDIGAYEYQGGE